MNNYFKPAYTRWFYSPQSFWENICATFRWIKHCRQRAFRGWADCDVWGFDYYLTQVIVSGLQHLKRTHHTYCTDTPEEWDEVLDIMIEGFKASDQIQTLDFMDDCIIGHEDKTCDVSDGSTFVMKDMPIFDMEKVRAEERILHEKFNKGMELFAKYYFGLWD